MLTKQVKKHRGVFVRGYALPVQFAILEDSDNGDEFSLGSSLIWHVDAELTKMMKGEFEGCDRVGVADGFLATGQRLYLLLFKVNYYKRPTDKLAEAMLIGQMERVMDQDYFGMSIVGGRMAHETKLMIELLWDKRWREVDSDN